MSLAAAALPSTRERAWTVTFLLMAMMVLLYLVGFAFIPYITVVTGEIPITYRITTLHFFVILASVRVGVRYSLVVGLLMGCLSVVYAVSVTSLTALMTLNLLVPRLCIPIASGLMYGAIQSWRNENLRLGLAAFMGTATNTLLYSAFVWLRLSIGSTYESATFGINATAFLAVAWQHFLIEAVFSAVFLLILNNSGKVVDENVKWYTRSRFRPLRVFVSYSHEDEEYRKDLDAHLSLFSRMGIIDVWHDRRIDPGAVWTAEISENLEKADLVLLLVSASFMKSNYCFQIELMRALERHSAGEARVIPVIVRPVSWSEAPFAHLQALPVDGRAVSLWKKKDEAWQQVADGIRNVARQSSNASESSSWSPT